MDFFVEQYRRIDDSVKKKIGWDVTEIAFLSGCFFSIILMFIRCFFGTEFTDEAFTVSDSLAVMHGNIPYAYSTLLHTGESFIPILFYKLYELCVPSLTGIFLYSRICFVVFRLIIIFGISVLLKDEVTRKWRMLVVGILIPFMGSVVNQNFSYNTISIYLFSLISIWLYRIMRVDKALKAQMIFCGFLSALMVFAHPVYGLSVLIFCVLILINSPKAIRIKRLVAYILGGTVEILVVLGCIISEVGLSKLLYGIETMITCGQDTVSPNAIERLIPMIFGCGFYLLIFSIAFCCAYYFQNLYIQDHGERLSTENALSFATLLGGIILCIIAISRRGGNTHLGIAVAVITIALFAFSKAFRRKGALIWYMGLPLLGYILFLTWNSIDGLGRLFYCIPLLVAIGIEIDKSDSRLVVQTGAVLFILIIGGQGFFDFKNIYRDDYISKLNTIVTEGVYKGIYTTEARANDIVELEKYINESISQDESVSFRDNVPVAYLMRNTNICDVRTWDEMQWSYDCDDPTSMYRYYKNREMIPDVICYVDFGRDESLSIENDSRLFQFNDFVNEYYYLDKDDFRNMTFRVLIYRNNETFDGDFEKLIDMVK